MGELLPCPFCDETPVPINLNEVLTICAPECPCADLQCLASAWNTRARSGEHQLPRDSDR
jgi:hypothetical protein